MSWHKFEDGKTIGGRGSEGGLIILDEEHEFGSRISLEQTGLFWMKKYVITCGIYGWMIHTNYAPTKEKALASYNDMRLELEEILNLIPTVEEANDGRMGGVVDEISKFIGRFQ